MRQVPGALGRPRGIGCRGRWEGGSGWGTYVNPLLIHVNVWQKPLQYCKVISLQLMKIKKKKRRVPFSEIKWRLKLTLILQTHGDSVKLGYSLEIPQTYSDSLEYLVASKCLTLTIPLFIYLWLHWVFTAACRFSLVVASNSYSLVACGAQTSHCSGFSYCRDRL